MHIDRQSINRDRNRQRLVTVLLFKGLKLLVLHLAAHRAEVGGAFGQGRRCGGGTGGLDLDVHVGIEALELFSPQGHQVGQGIGTDTGNVTGYTTGTAVFG